MTRVLVLVLLLSNAGCMYGYSIEADVQSRSEQTFASTEGPLDTYRFPSDIQRPYAEIARIKVIGGLRDTRRELIDRLHDEARAVGAHAVLEVHDGYEHRESGELFTELLGSAEPDTYDAAIVVAWAIRYRE